jgi:hypothetical protein
VSTPRPPVAIPFVTAGLFALAALSDSLGGWVFWVLSLLFAIISGVWMLCNPAGKKLPDTK